jgi:hypoxanthine phosphoribosyltransferase
MSQEHNASYDYENRQQMLPISWEDVFSLCKGLAQAIEPYRPEMILGIARGGLYPATLLSHLLLVEFYPIRLTRRFQDRVVYAEPQWLVRPPEVVRGQRVLIVDEICSQGVTLELARQAVIELGASDVRTAVLYAHSWAQAVPDYIGLISDALIMNPWDREIVRDGQFVMHPEYASALAQQGLPASEGLLLGLEAAPIAKW